MLAYLTERQGTLIALTMLLLCLAFAIMHFSRNENKPKAKLYVKVGIEAKAGTDKYLKMKIAIPYKSKEHKKEIQRKIPAIKDDFLESIDSADMDELLDRNQFITIKHLLLKAINHHTANPVGAIYFESCLYL